MAGPCFIDEYIKALTYCIETETVWQNESALTTRYTEKDMQTGKWRQGRSGTRSVCISPKKKTDNVVFQTVTQAYSEKISKFS